MEKLIPELRTAYPDITFTEAKIHSWSPKEQCITYCNDMTDESQWATLHELGHALLGHKRYDTDIALLRMEVDAWREAALLAPAYHMAITDDHIQSCLDTYRDWLHKRSTCPSCERHGVQKSASSYVCFNCSSTWRVSTDRFCRPYRLTQ